jgi:hypothetical protein
MRPVRHHSSARPAGQLREEVTAGQLGNEPHLHEDEADARGLTGDANVEGQDLRDPDAHRGAVDGGDGGLWHAGKKAEVVLGVPPVRLATGAAFDPGIEDRGDVGAGAEGAAAPVMTMAPMPESSLPHWMASWYSAIMRGLQAFSFSGRLSGSRVSRGLSPNRLMASTVSEDGEPRGGGEPSRRREGRDERGLVRDTGERPAAGYGRSAAGFR